MSGFKLRHPGGSLLVIDRFVTWRAPLTQPVVASLDHPLFAARNVIKLRDLCNQNG